MLHTGALAMYAGILRPVSQSQRTSCPRLTFHNRPIYGRAIRLVGNGITCELFEIKLFPREVSLRGSRLKSAKAGFLFVWYISNSMLVTLLVEATGSD